MIDGYSLILGIYIGMLIVLIGSGVGIFLMHYKEYKK